MKIEDIKLGTKARDKITGLTGIATTKTQWLNGCLRVGIQPQEIKDGKPVDPSFFDVEQVEFLVGGLVKESKRSGGPMPDPVRSADPKRSIWQD